MLKFTFSIQLLLTYSMASVSWPLSFTFWFSETILFKSTCFKPVKSLTMKGQERDQVCAHPGHTKNTLRRFHSNYEIAPENIQFRVLCICRVNKVNTLTFPFRCLNDIQTKGMFCYLILLVYLTPKNSLLMCLESSMFFIKSCVIRGSEPSSTSRTELEEQQGSFTVSSTFWESKNNSNVDKGSLFMCGLVLMWNHDAEGKLAKQPTYREITCFSICN